MKLLLFWVLFPFLGFTQSFEYTSLEILAKLPSGSKLSQFPDSSISKSHLAGIDTLAPQVYAFDYASLIVENEEGLFMLRFKDGYSARWVDKSFVHDFDKDGSPEYVRVISNGNAWNQGAGNDTFYVTTGFASASISIYDLQTFESILHLKFRGIEWSLTEDENFQEISKDKQGYEYSVTPTEYGIFLAKLWSTLEGDVEFEKNGFYVIQDGELRFVGSDVKMPEGRDVLYESQEAD